MQILRHYKKVSGWITCVLKSETKRRSLNLGQYAKLDPRYCGPFQVLSRIGPMANQHVVPSNIGVHNVFHVSLFKKYVNDHNNVIN